MKDVSKAVETVSVSLRDRLISNQHVGDFVMALLGRLIIIAAHQGKPIEGIQLTKPTWSGDSIKSIITFNSLAIPSIGVWGRSSDLMHYTLGRSTHMAKAFDKNPRLVDFFTSFVTLLDEFCEAKRLTFEDLKIEKSFITKEDLLVVTIDKTSFNRWDQ